MSSVEDGTYIFNFPDDVVKFGFPFCGSKGMEETKGTSFSFPEDLVKLGIPFRGFKGAEETKGTSYILADILDTPKEWVYYMDVPGFSKSEMQVTVEGGNTLVIRSDEKKKREDGKAEGCKYVRLERRTARKPLLRKFPLPENANASAITAKCENGELTVAVEKLLPSKPKTVEVAIA